MTSSKLSSAPQSPDVQESGEDCTDTDKDAPKKVKGISAETLLAVLGCADAGGDAVEDRAEFYRR